jgi:hypothetical protein
MNWIIKGTQGDKPVTLKQIGGPNTEAESRELLKGTHPSVTVTSITPLIVTPEPEPQTAQEGVDNGS